MKALTKLKLTVFNTILLVGCGSSTPQAPSSNSALNTISPTNVEKKPGAMQNSLDSWLKDDWEPTLSQDKEIQKKYVEKKDKPFTLQEYVDKAGAYMKAHPVDEKSSNVHKMESMPVIGK